MADYYVQGGVAFTGTIAELALLEEAFRASANLMATMDASDPSPAFMNAFPASDGADVWSGFRALFDDPDCPDFGADFSAAGPDHEALCSVTIADNADFQPDSIAALIQRCCRETLSKGPIGFEWAMTCSRLRLDGFGGGWCAIFADRIETGSTTLALRQALDMPSADCR